MDDLKDFEAQLAAIDDWLCALEERAAKDHTGLAVNQLSQARARLADARRQVGVRHAELCKVAMN